MDNWTENYCEEENNFFSELILFTYYSHMYIYIYIKKTRVVCEFRF